MHLHPITAATNLGFLNVVVPVATDKISWVRDHLSSDKNSQVSRAQQRQEIKTRKEHSSSSNQTSTINHRLLNLHKKLVQVTWRSNDNWKYSWNPNVEHWSNWNIWILVCNLSDDLNFGPVVCFSSHYLKNWLKLCYSGHQSCKVWLVTQSKSKTQ